MSWIAAGVAGGTALISGIGKSTAANKMVQEQKKALSELKESDYIPPALAQALANTEKRKNMSMYAGQDIDQANIEKNAADAFYNASRATTSSTNLVNATSAIQGQQNKAMQGVQRNLAIFKDNAEKDFTGLLLQKANAEAGNNRQYQAAKSALQGSIMQNRAIRSNAIWNSLAQVGGIAGGYGLRKGGFGGSGGYGGSSSIPTSSSNDYSIWAESNGY